MAKKNTKKRRVVKHDYELHMVWEHDPAGWYGIFTWFVDDEPWCTVTSKGVSVQELLQVLLQGMSQAQLDEQGNQLVLPDQGDWQVRYYPKRA